VQGLNDFKKSQYGGPCPPSRPHRYSFKIYALDSMLSLGSNASKSDLEKAMKGHILSQHQMTVRYQKKK
jgi:Raf kinase inhibitor-like YbhB/YbcL family protein